MKVLVNSKTWGFRKMNPWEFPEMKGCIEETDLWRVYQLSKLTTSAKFMKWREFKLYMLEKGWTIVRIDTEGKMG